MDELFEIKKRLWNETITETDASSVQDHTMRQYELCVELADRISQRRGAANTFFLTFNTLAVGALSGVSNFAPARAIIILCFAGMLLCVIWAVLLLSYRRLNTAKFKVIGLLEERLPASPLWAAEWKALGEGKDYSKYIPLTFVETWIPIIFGLVYLAVALLEKGCVTS